MIVEVIIAVVVTIFIILSNSLSIALLIFVVTDPFSPPQGLDYCIISLAIADLINGIIVAPLSISSLITEKWIFGTFLCKTLGHIFYSLWFVDSIALYWLSVDRYLYITDIKYSTYKIRTRSRCICKIILSWIIAVLYCFAPLMVNKEASFLKQPSICVANWFSLEAYYLTVTCILTIPTFFATFFNFTHIFMMRIKYRTGRISRKLKEAYLEYLMDPNHIMSLILALIFWLSWLPYTIHIFQYKISGPLSPAFSDIWIGLCQSMLKFPILIGCCPRYRTYFVSLCQGRNTDDDSSISLATRPSNNCSPIEPLSYYESSSSLYI